ncbi:MAG TPA: CheR family methyltransferase [Burkholderiaceae bacterium]|nr:CheR family methyltransferase [Burkholderiaceae bacterium]
MILDEFEKLLKQTMGLDAASIGISAVERAVQTRLLACQLTNAQAYWEYLQVSTTELHDLIEAVVVPETWFFRDREAFAAMTRLAYEEWARTHADGTLSLLSLPCSTGEEPYSMAMALLDAGFPASRFRIDAVDISTRVLVYAERAVYGKNSFRGNDLSFRDRHFQPSGDGYRVSEAVRQQARFQQGNLFDSNFLPGTDVYDFIFCRNVLIYFDRATQDRAIQVLTRLLTAKGVLFVGPSETGLLLSHDYDSVKLPLAFGFRKAETQVPVAKIVESVKRPLRAKTPAPAPTLKPKPVRLAVPARLPSQPAGAKPNFEDLQRLADQGHLAEATRGCDQYIREHGPSAPVFCLLGLMRDASGNHAEAAEFYRKALYLDPQHRETLAHLAFLLEHQGDIARAQRLHERARRPEQKLRK